MGKVIQFPVQNKYEQPICDLCSIAQELNEAPLSALLNARIVVEDTGENIIVSEYIYNVAMNLASIALNLHKLEAERMVK